MINFEKVTALIIKKLARLDINLTYHCLDHTLDVFDQCVRLAKEENVINQHEVCLLKIAALYHDTGFLKSYSAHEAESCEIFLNDSDDFGLTVSDKDIIVNLIMATQIPQLPSTLLEKIICDADLDYLGRDDFFLIGKTLRKEFLHFKIVLTNQDWEKLQLKFLRSHYYHTSSSQRLREPVKQINLLKLK